MRQKKPAAFKVHSLESEGRFFLLALKPASGKRFSFKPGQFVKIYPEEGGDFEPFSFFSAPQEKEIRFMFDNSSAVKSALSAKKKGEKVFIEGPYGDFTASKTPTHSVLLCKGLGLIPISSIGKALIENRKNFNIYIIYENLTRNEILNEQRLVEFDKHKQVNILMTLLNERPLDWNGRLGPVSREMIEDFVPSPKTKDYYICGPAPFVNRISALLSQMGVSKGRIRLESWS